ncbi:hypothetical protein AB0O34_36395 [Sphaerisporangium sp. NPDC088356]|uniref:hypothetical protein n=1 Tax=Sphaerisporangium sp. NPDC088356 TaxID=3154871 RepID=UPI003419D860
MRTSSNIRGVLALAAITAGGVWLGMGSAAAAVPGGDDPLTSQESSNTAPVVSDAPTTPSTAPVVSDAPTSPSTAPVVGDAPASQDPSSTAPVVSDPLTELQVPSVIKQSAGRDLITDIQHIGTNVPDAPASDADPAPGLDSTPDLPGLPVDDPQTPPVPGAETDPVAPSAVPPQESPSLGDVAGVAPADAAHQPEAGKKDDKASLTGNATEPQKDDEAVSAGLEKVPFVDATMPSISVL